jgi:hypothetical protein
MNRKSIDTQCQPNLLDEMKLPWDAYGSHLAASMN